MLSLNEDNQYLLSSTPTDMRVGVNGMYGKVRQAGLDPTYGKVFVFVGKGRRLMKLPRRPFSNLTRRESGLPVRSFRPTQRL